MCWYTKLDSTALVVSITASILDLAAPSSTRVNEFFHQLQSFGGESHHVACPVTSEACIQVSLETSVLTYHSKCNIAALIMPS